MYQKNHTISQLKTSLHSLGKRNLMNDVPLERKGIYILEDEIPENLLVKDIGTDFEMKAYIVTLEDVECCGCDTLMQCFVSPCGHNYCTKCFVQFFLDEISKQNKYICQASLLETGRPSDRDEDMCGYEFTYDFVNIIQLNEENIFKIGKAFNDLAMTLMLTKHCPECKIDCIRVGNDVKLRCNNEQCLIKKIFFCWYCGFKWLSNTSNQECGNELCIGEDPLLKFIRECGPTELTLSGKKVSVPSVRLCPFCSAPYLHSGKNCKMIHGCNGCKRGWCFCCLKPEKINENGRRTPTCSPLPYDLCEVAPVQTNYPNL